MIRKEKDEEFVSPSALDDQLNADKDGSFKKEIIEKLDDYQRKVKSAMNKGDLAPNQFEAADDMYQAIENAKYIIKDRANVDRKKK